jgi:SAM-dependent methyltransferase
MADDAFTPDWLALREGVDHRSRPTALLRPLRAAWHAREWSRVLDLGSGTGSNFRYLASRLPGRQEWTLVDHDPDLLERVHGPAPDPLHPQGSAIPVHRVVGDLAEEGLARVHEADLVTASALLDLVTRDWLTALVERCREAGCGALLALSYDGTIAWSPTEDPDDGWVEDMVNAHQRRKKGLGPALGPTAPHVAETLFQEHGFHTWGLPSPWHLGPSDLALARALVEGWVHAVGEQAPSGGSRVERWGERRLQALARGDVGLTVGHLDLLALPAFPGAG